MGKNIVVDKERDILREVHQARDSGVNIEREMSIPERMRRGDTIEAVFNDLGLEVSLKDSDGKQVNIDTIREVHIIGTIKGTSQIRIRCLVQSDPSEDTVSGVETWTDYYVHDPVFYLSARLPESD